LIKVNEYFPLRNLRDVVHALARIVTNAGILVAETREDRGYNFFEIASDFLECSQYMVWLGISKVNLPVLRRLRLQLAL